MLWVSNNFVTTLLRDEVAYYHLITFLNEL